MPGPVAERSNRLPPYRGMVVASLRLGMVLALGLFANGCAMSGGLGGMFAKHQKTEEVQATALASEDVTSSTDAPTLRAPTAIPTSGLPSDTDLVFTHMAIVEVLKRHGDADCQRLCPGRRDLPRFPGELCPPPGPGTLAARPGLPWQNLRQAGGLGGQKPSSLDAVLNRGAWTRS